MTAENVETYHLLRAVLSLGADLDLSSVLERFVQVSAHLTDAQYAAINILDAQGASVTFLQHGVPDDVARLLRHPPHARGVLGEIPHHGVLRLADLREHPAFRGFPEHHPDMGPFLGTAVRVRGDVFGYLYLANKDGGFVEADADVVQALAAGAAVAIQNAQLYSDAHAREAWLRAGQEITTMMLSGADQEEALEHIAARAREIAEADTAILALPGLAGELVFEIVKGEGRADLLGHIAPREGRTWRAMLGGAGEIVESLHKSRRVLVEPLRQFGPALYAPLQAEGQAAGVLVLLRRIGAPPFGPHDLLTARSFAAQAALALRLADAKHVEDANALLSERERIARDLHDLAVQQLFAAGLQLESVRRTAAANPATAGFADDVDQALDGVDASVRQIRSIVAQLKDPDAATALVERLRREVALARTGLGFAPTFLVWIDGEPVDSGASADLVDAVVDGDLADDVVAVVREGLANAARHARAASVAVRVSVTQGDPGEVLVEVEDDGVGVDAPLRRASGTSNLAARARQHDGAFALSGAPAGRGSLLTWRARVR